MGDVVIGAGNEAKTLEFEVGTAIDVTPTKDTLDESKDAS
jgi:hypothetical protein